DLYRANFGRFRMRGPALKVLAASYGKALKTFEAIRIACESGYGEDGMVLLRSLANLTINLAYIGRGPDPGERAREFVASGRLKHREFLRQFPQLPPRWGMNEDWPTIERRAKCWDGVKIWKRAEAAGMADLYRQAYAFGSSYEHSDSASLDGYF